jgi:hypothetical protein
MVFPHAAPHQHHPAQSAIASTRDVPMEVDSLSDGGSDPVKANVFGNTVFDDPSFRHVNPWLKKKHLTYNGMRKSICTRWR